jgi:hypothetical protein
MRKLISVVLFSIYFITGCASGPSYSVAKNEIPVLAQGYSRIFFYRTSHFGGAYQPVVYINDQAYGKAYLSGVFFKDVPPGKYKITTAMSQGNEVDLNLSAGESIYIKFVARIGFAVYPVLVEPAVGQVDIQSMAYVKDPNNPQK